MKFHNFNKVNPSILLGLEMATPDRPEWPCLTKEYIRGSCVRKTDATMDWLVFQLIVIMALTAQGLQINTTNNQVLERAVGQNVKLDCEFTTVPEDAGDLEVEWSVKSIRHPVTEILMYTAGYIYDHYYGPLKDRVYFHSEDPGKRDASIDLLLLTPSDTGFYYCQVKKVPGIKSIKAVLRVLEPSSKSRCYHTEGAGKVGTTQVLKCRSGQGAAPTW